MFCFKNVLDTPEGKKNKQRQRLEPILLYVERAKTAAKVEMVIFSTRQINNETTGYSCTVVQTTILEIYLGIRNCTVS